MRQDASLHNAAREPRRAPALRGRLVEVP